MTLLLHSADRQLGWFPQWQYHKGWGGVQAGRNMSAGEEPQQQRFRSYTSGTRDAIAFSRSLQNGSLVVSQVGMNMSANEEPQEQHYGFYTFGLFTSQRRALACIQARGMNVGVLTILPVSINEPLKPCLSSDILTAHETRQMVSPAHG